MFLAVFVGFVRLFSGRVDWSSLWMEFGVGGFMNGFFEFSRALVQVGGGRINGFLLNYKLPGAVLK